MSRQNNRPRSFNSGSDNNNDNFFYRLFRNQRFLAFIGLVLLVLISFPLFRTYTQKRMIEEEIAQMNADIETYEQETEKLQKMIEYLGSEESLEAQARLNLNLKKPGETVVVIEREGEDFESLEKEDDELNVSNFKKWKEYFLSSNS